LKEDVKNHVNPDICEFAGIAHDLGHPPFGHQGEEALDECMGDFGGFEGNAQTLRILTRVEKKEKLDDPPFNTEYRFGLNLTYRSLASILKYDNPIPNVMENREEEDRKKAVKGYYGFDTDLVERIKQNVAGRIDGKFKTVECKIMDIADDIAYSTYDLEDGFKAGFYHPTIFFSYPNAVFENVAKKVEKALKKDENIDKNDFSADEVREELFTIFSSVYDYTAFDLNIVEDEKGNEYIAVKKDVSKEAMLSEIVNGITKASKSIAEDGYLRNNLTSELVNSAVQGIIFKLNKECPAMSDVYLEERTRIRVEVLKNFTYESQILSPRLKVAEFRGKEIIKFIFDVLKEDEGWRLMPSDYQNIYHHFSELKDKYRCICDFISGMTDRYAIEFYGRHK
jgi:dGTPase